MGTTGLRIVERLSVREDVELLTLPEDVRKDPAARKEMIAECRERGALVIKVKHKVRLLPALNIPMEQLQKAIKTLKKVIEA